MLIVIVGVPFLPCGRCAWRARCAASLTAPEACCAAETTARTAEDWAALRAFLCRRPRRRTPPQVGLLSPSTCFPSSTRRRGLGRSQSAQRPVIVTVRLLRQTQVAVVRSRSPEFRNSVDGCPQQRMTQPSSSYVIAAPWQQVSADDRIRKTVPSLRYSVLSMFIEANMNTRQYCALKH